MVNYLIEVDQVDVNATTRRREWTPLHFVADEGSLDMAKLLVDAGAE